MNHIDPDRSDPHRRITDEGVARLPLAAGRAELLEEIMAQSTNDTGPATLGATVHDFGRRRWTRWAVPGAAAAAVAALVIAPQALDRDDKPVVEASYAAPGAGSIAVLDAKGWTLDDGSVDEYGGELSYEGVGGDELQISWRLAADYAAYVADRDDIGPSTSLEVLGADALKWAYNKTDHTVIRAVEGEFFLEVRGEGMGEKGFGDLLNELTAIEPSDLDAHLPPSFVTAGERPAVIAQMLEDIPLPHGFDSDIESDEISRYQLAADVTGAVACAWVAQYEGKSAAASAEAADALIGARDWTVLKEIAGEGGWSDAIWEIGRRIEHGRSLEGVAGGSIGCDEDVAGQS